MYSSRSKLEVQKKRSRKSFEKKEVCSYGVAYFPPRCEVCAMLGAAGFQGVGYKDLTFGASTIFMGTKEGSLSNC
ncbi:MAG: hypothetical protein CMH60_02405 [Myxococcales bacterium]|nr:hypothetical protein [Myxococcales bacterium]